MSKLREAGVVIGIIIVLASLIAAFAISTDTKTAPPYKTRGFVMAGIGVAIVTISLWNRKNEK